MAFTLHARYPGMHELALIESVIDAITEQVGDARVAIIRLEIGELAGVATDALRFSFEVCAHGTALADASLEIISVVARGRCRRCGAEDHVVSFASPCACGSFERELLQGGELRLREVEVY